MKYFVDTEFIEAFHKPFLGKRRHFIDLISIGIVAEDGREYFAVSSDYDFNKASPWVIDNVIVPLYTKTVHGDPRNLYDASNFHIYFGKTNSQIAEEIDRFVNPIEGPCFDPLNVSENYIKLHNCKTFSDGHPAITYQRAQPEFWADYGAYDWVVICSLFGTMMDLPKGYPMFCRDLQQLIADKVRDRIRPGSTIEPAFMPLEECVRIFEGMYGYPVNQRPHDALSDARHERDVYNFLMK